MIRHLYVHIPFCPKICPYCSFYKEASDRNKTQAFLDAVLLELDQQLAVRELKPETIFFGGGTPSALSTSQLEFLLRGLRERLPLEDLEEWTLEMNPATVSAEKAQLLLDLGVNRISMGVQSWDPSLLKILGRVHSAEQARRSYEILRESGVDNLNLDLIFGVPTQTSEQWFATLKETISLKPEHISAYCLTYEEDTDFFRRFISGDLKQDTEWDAAVFEGTMEQLEQASFAQYEISNYSRPGRECRHNLAYWRGADYLGLGPSAFSTWGNDRWQNVENTAEYIARIGAGQPAANFHEPLSPTTRRAERIAFSLRTAAGVSHELLEPWPQETADLLAEGLLEQQSSCYRLSRRGKMVADSVAALFI